MIISRRYFLLLLRAFAMWAGASLAIASCTICMNCTSAISPTLIAYALMKMMLLLIVAQTLSIELNSGEYGGMNSGVMPSSSMRSSTIAL